MRAEVAAQNGRKRRPEAEDHRHVGHQALRLHAAVEVADDGHADHHAAARKEPLEKAENHQPTERGRKGRAEA